MGRYITRCFLGPQVVHCGRQKWKNPVESLSHLVIYSVLFLGLNFFLSHQKIKESAFNPLGLLSVQHGSSCGQIFILFFYNLVAIKMFESKKKKKKVWIQSLKISNSSFSFLFLILLFAFTKQAREQPHLSQSLWRRLQGLRGSFRLELGHSWACSSPGSKKKPPLPPPAPIPASQAAGLLKHLSFTLGYYKHLLYSWKGPHPHPRYSVGIQAIFMPQYTAWFWTPFS